MSEGEQKLVGTAGDYRYVVRDGEPLEDPDWRSCRIILTDERLVLATSGGKQAIPLGRITLPESQDEVVPEPLQEDGTTALSIGENVILIDAQGVDDFESEYCRAVLHDEVILVTHEAVVGGVVQDDTAWSKARFRFDDDRVVLGLPGGDRLSFAVADVGTVETETQTVRDETREVVAVEHTDAEDRSVETHFSGTDTHARALSSLFSTVVEARKQDYELSEAESQVLMALYSGVSPFEMADFVGLPVDEVEEIYQTLLDVGAVDEVRTRTEVSLNAHGRNLASEAMSEQ
jgi:helix-turn-helix protein